jgi:hypothetical protein
MEVKKYGIRLPINVEHLLPSRSPKVKERRRIPPTEEQKAAYQDWKERTEALIDEGRANGWWSDGMPTLEEGWSFEEPADVFEYEYERDEDGEIIYEERRPDSLIPTIDFLNSKGSKGSTLEWDNQ